MERLGFDLVSRQVVPFQSFRVLGLTNLESTGAREKRGIFSIAHSHPIVQDD